MAHFIIIGSGPSGTSAAFALLDNGHSVHMVDGGMRLEPDTKKIIDELSELPSDQWDQAAIDKIKSGPPPSTGGIAEKRIYGSRYPYAAPKGARLFRTKNAHTHVSYAPGGLSTVWGGAILPSLKSDIANWPISSQELAPHYEAILKHLPRAGGSLKDLFDLEEDYSQPFSLSTGAQACLHRMTQNRNKLSAQGIRFGLAHLAAELGQSSDETSCAYCGLCLHGCPQRRIYSSENEIAALNNSPDFTYTSGILAQRITENASGVSLQAFDQNGNPLTPIKADKCIVAAGPFASTAIIMDSLEMYGREKKMLHSDHLLIPMLHLSASGKFDSEPRHSLAQIFMEINAPELDSHLIHCQLYGYNDMYTKTIKEILGKTYAVARPFIRPLEGRLMLIQGYLHSQSSAHMKIKLAQGPGATATVSGHPNTKAIQIKNTLTRKLLTNAFNIGAIPILPMAKVGTPGAGNHSGGSFPMSLQPKEGETDTLGRPWGLKNIHMIDSSILPDIPATTITLTVMANARRIGSTL